MISSSDSDFIPNSDDQHIKIMDPKQLNKKRKTQLKMKDVSTKYSGLWNRYQNQIYIQFLAQNKDDFQGEYQRRSRKVFNRLSKLLPHRTSQQCRSHHQKLQLRSNSEKPQDIIQYVTSRILKKKDRSSAKTTPDQYDRLQERGYVITEGAYKQTKIILNYNFVQSW